MLANKTKGLLEEFFIGCFVSGLKEEIKAEVLMFKPKTISQAMGLARLQEDKLTAIAKKMKPHPKFNGP